MFSQFHILLVLGQASSRWLVRVEKSYLGSQDSGLNQLERLAVDPDQALSGLALSDSLIVTHSVSQMSSSSLANE